MSAITPDPQQAKQFLKILCGDTVPTFQTFSDREDTKIKRPGKRDYDPLAQVFHSATEKHGNTLIDLNIRGAGVFIMVNAGDGVIHENATTCRNAHNVTEIRAVFGDLDGAPLEPVTDCGLTPHIVVESSPGRYHAYWKVSDCNLEQFTPIQKAIAAKFNGDKSVNDLPRVMRVPGFIHQKKEPFLTRIIDISDHAPYTVQQLVNGLNLKIENQHERKDTGHASDDDPFQGSSEGGRTKTIERAAGVLFSKGYSLDDAVSFCETLDLEKNNPPLAETHPGKVRATVDGIHRRYFGNEWPEPLPIESKIEPEDYPIDALLETIRLAVDEVLSFVKAPTPLVVSAALSALSMAVQSHADVMRAEKLTGPSSLFLLTIAESGERKSTCDGFFTSAIRDYDKQQKEAAKPLIQKYEAEFTSWESECKGVNDAIRLAAKSGENTEDKKAELLILRESKPEAPRVPKIIHEDATPESLKFVLAKQWPSGAVVSSEAGVVFGSHGMGKESVMRNLATLNQLWDGADMQVERRSSESYSVTGARFSMSIMVQEATLRAFFKQDNGLARGTGFLARFLIAWPESTQGYRPFTEAPENWPHLAAFNRRISAILNQDAPIDEDGALHPVMMALTPEAKAAWINFHDAIESMLASGGELFDVRDVASKTADNAARLACLFHVFEHGVTGCIDIDAMESACRVTAWHLNEARRFFAGLALPQELADAARLDAWMIEYCRQEKTAVVPVGKIQQYGPCGLRSKVAIDAAMEELEALERARRVKDGKRKTIHINPALLRGES